jgi:HPt (histidine-containing phosphotransfer) domain-containing protein
MQPWFNTAAAVVLATAISFAEIAVAAEGQEPSPSEPGVEQLPSREWERLRRASQAEGAQLDSTHPPNAYRKAFLQAHRIAEPAFTVEASAMVAIDAELQGLEDRLGRRLIARFARD